MSQSALRSCSLRFLSTFGCALLAFAAGCTTGQIGGEIEHTDGPGGETDNEFGCEEVETNAIAVDEETSIGITAQDVIDAINGTHETTLSWGEDIPDLDATIIPEAGESSITIEVIPRPESATFVDLEVSESDGAEEQTLMEEPSGAACADEVRVVADVVVTSENGALNDSFEVTFRASSESVVFGDVAVTPGELEGSFDVTMEGNGEPVQTSLSLTFAYGTASGKLSGLWQEELGDSDDDETAVSGAPIVYGRFPASDCEAGTPIGEDSPWSETILDAVNSNTDFDFNWQSGQATTLTLAPTVGTLCLEVNQYEGGGTIVANVSTLVLSEDGRINAAWDLELRAPIGGDDITSIDLRDVEKGYEGYAAEEFPTETGISGVESDASDLGFAFVYTIGLDGGTTGGTLTVLELGIPDCARPDDEPEVDTNPDGGSGVDGCAGTEFTEIETATFVAADSQPGD